MKKILMLVMAIVVAVSVLTLVACGGEKTTTTKQTTTTPDVTTTPSTTTEGTPTGTTTPKGTTTVNVTTTIPVTTTPVVTTTATPATPNTKDPAKTYYVEPTTVKCNQYGHDDAYLYYSDAGVNGNERFADGHGMIVYEFDISEMIEPTVVLKIRQNYLVYITDDPAKDYEEMTELANFKDVMAENPDLYEIDPEKGCYTGGQNSIDLVVDPYQHGYYGYFCIVIVNCNNDMDPPPGWGGTISQFTINQYKEGTGPVTTVIDHSGTAKYPTSDMVETSDVYLTTGADEDAEFIIDNTSQSSETRRYCDNAGYIIYRIPVKEFTQPTIDLYIVQNYKIEIRGNLEDDWKEVANFSKTTEYADLKTNAPGDFDGDIYKAGNNFTTLTIDPYEYEIYGYLYIRISNCFSGGWGGTIESLTINYYK